MSLRILMFPALALILSAASATAATADQGVVVPAGSGAAGSGAPGPGASTPGAPTPAPAATTPRAAATPMHAEIQQSLEAEQAELVRLQTSIEQTTDLAAGLQLQQQIESVKLRTQVDILRIQARYARVAGKTATAEELDEIIEKLTRPPAPGIPVDRPQPAAPAAPSSK